MSEYNLHPATQAAIQAFEEVERVRLLLDKKERDLSHAVVRMAVEAPDEDKTPYFDYTTDVLRKYEEKREKVGL